MAKVKSGVQDIDGLMMENEVVLARCRGLSPVSQEDAINWGLSGPMLRATGLAHDIRRAEPYSIYDRFEFDIPTGRQGDVYDRMYVRLEEMKQSIRIVEQAQADPVERRLPPVGSPPVGSLCVRSRTPLRGERRDEPDASPDPIRELRVAPVALGIDRAAAGDLDLQ